MLDYEKDEVGNLFYKFNKNLVFSKCIKKEKPSSDYCFYATKERHNPITDEKEPYFPLYIAKFRRFIGSIVLLTFMLITILSHVLIIIVRLGVYHFMFLAKGLRPFSILFSNLISSFLNIVTIVTIDKTFGTIAAKITKWGNVYKH